MAVTLKLDSRPDAANCARDEIRHRLRGRLDDGPLLDLQLIVGSGDVAIRELADDSGGFGLRIVASLADRWGVYEDGSHVWFEMFSPRAR